MFQYWLSKYINVNQIWIWKLIHVNYKHSNRQNSTIRQWFFFWFSAKILFQRWVWVLFFLLHRKGFYSWTTFFSWGNKLHLCKKVGFWAIFFPNLGFKNWKISMPNKCMCNVFDSILQWWNFFNTFATFHWKNFCCEY